MAEARPDARADADEGAEGLDVDSLKAAGDLAALLRLARDARSGALAAGRDMALCFAAYRAAAELGSAEADYAVALFHLTGGGVPQDLKEGATALRRAAEKGSIPAKVYLGNLYELGIHYKANPEKADVWYRNAARSARIASSAEDGGEDAYRRALAELGCARYVRALVDGEELAEDERARLLQRARAHGLGLRIKDEQAEPTPRATPAERTTLLDSLGSAEDTAAEAAKPTPIAPIAPAKAAKAPSAAPYALAAFGYALLFAVAGLGAAYAATLGAQELVASGTPLPGLGARTDLVFPIVFGIVGVLPAGLVYRPGAVLKAVVAGAALGGIGWVAWGTGQVTMHGDRLVQALAFALPGFLATLLVIGFLGGTKKGPPRRPDART